MEIKEESGEEVWVEMEEKEKSWRINERQEKCEEGEENMVMYSTRKIKIKFPATYNGYLMMT